MNDKPTPPAPSTTPMTPNREAPAQPAQREKTPPFDPTRETTREGGRRDTTRESGRK